VRERGNLGADGVNELWHGVTDGGYRDARTEVQDAVPSTSTKIARRRVRCRWKAVGQSRADDGLAALMKCSRLGPGSSVTTLRVVPTEDSTDETMAFS